MTEEFLSISENNLDFLGFAFFLHLTHLLSGKREKLYLQLIIKSIPNFGNVPEFGGV